MKAIQSRQRNSFFGKSDRYLELCLCVISFSISLGDSHSELCLNMAKMTVILLFVLIFRIKFISNKVFEMLPIRKYEVFYFFFYKLLKKLF